MPVSGRTIRLFLVDGSPTGVLTAEIMNWTGHILSAPRARIVEVLKRTEASRTGVYFLIGSDPADSVQPIVYIGESDNVGERLATHSRDENKAFWETTCIITNKDSNLTKAHVRYLESRLIQIAKRAGLAKLQNGTAPEYGYLPESDVADMEYFLEQLQTLLPALGIHFLRLTPQVSYTKAGSGPVLMGDCAPEEADPEHSAQSRRTFGQDRPTAYGGESPLFEFSDGHATVYAEALEVDGEMIVLAGSTAREVEAPSLSASVRQFRRQLRESGKLVPSGADGTLKFLEDVAFSSPSAASQAVMATSRNGRTDWKVAGTGETYASWQEAQIAKIRREDTASE